MGTKMAPCFASLFWGKLDMDIFGYCDKTPLIWLRYIDDIFMIRNYSEQDLHAFISRINRFHDTIKFTSNFSNKEATFLDGIIKLKENGALDTSAHEKGTNCHQYIEVSSCHPLSCKQGIPYSQSKRYRRITSDNACFENDLGRLNGVLSDKKLSYTSY